MKKSNHLTNEIRNLKDLSHYQNVSWNKVAKYVIIKREKRLINKKILEHKNVLISLSPKEKKIYNHISIYGGLWA